MKKVYLDSTIPSYLVGEPSPIFRIRSWQDVTQDWWRTDRVKYDVYISDVVI